MSNRPVKIANAGCRVRANTASSFVPLKRAAVASTDRWNRFFYGAAVSNLGQDRCALAEGATPIGWSNLADFEILQTKGGGASAAPSGFHLRRLARTTQLDDLRGR